MLFSAAGLGLLLGSSATRPEALAASAAFGALALSLFALRGSYRPRLGLGFLDEAVEVVKATTFCAMALISARAVLAAGHESAIETVQYWGLATALLVTGRGLVLEAERRDRRRGEIGEPTLVVGAGKVGRLVAKRLVENPEVGLKPIGFLDLEPLESEEDGVRLPVVGASWDLDRIVLEHGVKHAVIAFSTAPHEVILSVARRCHELDVSVSVLPRLFEIGKLGGTGSHLGAIPLVPVQAVHPSRWQLKVKYALERTLAAVALVATLPLLIAAAVGIRLTMGSPVLFRQLRAGADGRRFRMLKLRTMKGRPEHDGEADIDWAIAQLGQSADAPMQTLNGDVHGVIGGDRSTVLGQALRRFSLDELPQLWNVVRGDMSLVGPRPERVAYARRFERSVYRYADRHRVKSGITGWAQVNGLRGRTSLSDRVEWDNYYIENWSPWLDLKIVLLTVACILRGQHERGDR
jgi:exopolysaccharide biosynthesis polyprenyl glycosylphosphotransferase